MVLVVLCVAPQLFFYFLRIFGFLEEGQEEDLLVVHFYFFDFLLSVSSLTVTHHMFWLSIWVLRVLTSKQIF